MEDLSQSCSKIRVLIITMGGNRQAVLKEMFASPSMIDHFHVEFSPGIPSRELRSRAGLMTHGYKVGIIPEAEYKAFETIGRHEKDQAKSFDCLKDVPVAKGRRGAETDVEQHYCVELWRKSKGINRDRSVLACTFAHLIAMRRCVDEKFDVILEDNVRSIKNLGGNGAGFSGDEDATEAGSNSNFCECAKRIRDTIMASSNESGDQKCDLRYFGWLGSVKNLSWVIETHAKRTTNSNQSLHSNNCSTFPFPTPEHFEGDDLEKVGGTPIWGAYAYWISEEGLNAVLSTLQKDVGAMLWKGKRMRAYKAKPIDKIMPRRVIDAGLSVHVGTHPAFFRAPMLTSKIHKQWDPEFCKSTEYQLECSGSGGLGWNNIWLREQEKRVVALRHETGKWFTEEELKDKSETLEVL